MELCIKEKELSLPEKFDIYDENGNIKYYVVKKIALKQELTIYNLNKECIAKLKQCSFHSLSSFLVNVAGKEYHLIQKFHMFRSHIHLKENGWELKGDFTSHNYEIYNLSTQVATIHQKWLSFGNCYHLQCEKSTDDLLALCIVLAVDTIEKLRQK